MRSWSIGSRGGALATALAGIAVVGTALVGSAEMAERAASSEATFADPQWHATNGDRASSTAGDERTVSLSDSLAESLPDRIRPPAVGHPQRFESRARDDRSPVAVPGTSGREATHVAATALSSPRMGDFDARAMQFEIAASFPPPDPTAELTSLPKPIRSAPSATPSYLVPATADGSLSSVPTGTLEKAASYDSTEANPSSASSADPQPTSVDAIDAVRQTPDSDNAPTATSSSYIAVTHRAPTAEERLMSEFHVAASAYTNGDHTGAARRLEDLLSQDDGLHRARLLLARLYADRNLVGRAESLLSDGLLHFPDHAPYSILYAQMLAEQGRDGIAIQALKDALPAANGNAKLHALLAGLYQRTGDSAAAARSYQAALQLDATSGEWWMGLGISSEQLGDTETAENAYRSALQRSLNGELEQFVKLRLGTVAAEKAISNESDSRD